ncbi:MAG: peptidylprolyl isomerase [Spirulina sp. SIO3F2]|nr:peptidylprolyl isomerase [Spirulina sp. SIO3F2]
MKVLPSLDDMSQVLQIGDYQLAPEELVARLKQYQLLPQLERELRIDQAIGSIACSEKESQFACEQFYQQRHLNSPEQRQQWHQQQGLSAVELIAFATRQLRINKFKTQTWGSQLESYFLKRKPDLDLYSFSILSLPEPGIAQELYYRLELGEQTFAEIAREHATDAERQTGGRIGPVPLGQLTPALARCLKSNPPGTLVPPFALGEGVVIVQVGEVKAARLDEPMRRQLLDELFEQWLTGQ